VCGGGGGCGLGGEGVIGGERYVTRKEGVDTHSAFRHDSHPPPSKAPTWWMEMTTVCPARASSLRLLSVVSLWNASSPEVGSSCAQVLWGMGGPCPYICECEFYSCGGGSGDMWGMGGPYVCGSCTVVAGRVLVLCGGWEGRGHTFMGLMWARPVPKCCGRWVGHIYYV
jgi:hypothetical protein